MNRETRIPDRKALLRGDLRLESRHFEADEASRRAPDGSIKPHGVQNQGVAMNKELEAYPKCL